MGLSCAGLDSHAEASGLTRNQGQRKQRAEKKREKLKHSPQPTVHSPQPTWSACSISGESHIRVCVNVMGFKTATINLLSL